MLATQSRGYARSPWLTLFSISLTKGCESKSPQWYLNGRSGQCLCSSKCGIGVEQVVLSTQNFDEDEEEAGLGFQLMAFAGRVNRKNLINVFQRVPNEQSRVLDERQ